MTGDWLPRERQNPAARNPLGNEPAVNSALGPLKSRALYIVLGLLLGGLGIHNFYAGRVGMGAAQLITTILTGWLIVPLLLVGLWALIEVCVVNTDGYKRRMV